MSSPARLRAGSRGAVSTEDLDALPRRVFLDSCTLQTLRDYGCFIWEGEPLDIDDRLHSIPDGVANVEALRKIFLVGERAPFEWILSEASIAEASDKRDRDHLQWALDVLEHTLTCLHESGGPTTTSVAHAKLVDGARFNFLSAKDRQLVRDAVLFDCDAFLTMERHLPRNAQFIQRELGLQVLRPIQHWALLNPWANLWA